MKEKGKKNKLLRRGCASRIQSYKPQVIMFLVMVFWVFPNRAVAQILCETEPATTDPTNMQSSNRLMDAVIVGVAIMIVLFTLVMSIKYLFKPGENNPEHIKNIVKDEGF